MKIIAIPVTTIQENTYLFYDPDTKEGVIIDPGGESQRLIKRMKDENINLKAILLTHGHFDHISAVEKIKEETGAMVVCNKAEEIVLTDSRVNMTFPMMGKDIQVFADIFLQDEEIFTFGSGSRAGNMELRMLHTPGHTPGGACFYSESEKIVFSGDTLFYGSVGRSDFTYGNEAQLLESIRNKLMVLPDDVTVYPGHGQATTIGYERKFNPFV